MFNDLKGLPLFLTDFGRMISPGGFYKIDVYNSVVFPFDVGVDRRVASIGPSAGTDKVFDFFSS